MFRRLPAMAAALGSGGLLLATLTTGAPAAASSATLVPMAVEAPDTSPQGADVVYNCTTPTPVHQYVPYHCYTPDQIAAAYGVDKIHAAGDLGQNQTIVLVDSYGSPTAANDINFFYQTFYKGKTLADGTPYPAPNFTEWYPFGNPTANYTCTKSAGVSGPCSAANWSFEATLDIEWAYAMAPAAHIVLLATPPAETLGVPGLPNMFKAMKMAVDKFGPGTVFSQSFGLAEQTFGGAALQQMQSFDQTYAYGESKGDSFLAASGDEGNGGNSKNKKFSGVISTTAVGFPAVSPLVTAAGGTQLMYGWTWAPTSSDPFASTNSGNSEALWNECWLFGGGNCVTGGGTSDYFAAPAYQSGIDNGGMRSIPDLSWNAAVNGGVLVYITAYPTAIRPGWHITGGTSAASPQLAGVVALANEMRAAANKAPLAGNLNADIYQLGHLDKVAGPDSSFDGNGSSYFRDILPQIYGSAPFGVLDNNAWPPAVGVTPYYASTGYDMTTGFGTPRVDRFVPALANLP